MTAWHKAILIFLGAGLGGNARYWLGGWITTRCGAAFPWGTLSVNVTGCLLLGLFMGLAIRGGWHDAWRLLLAVGFLGGFTTFSAFSHETLQLMEEGAWGPAAANAALSVVAGLAACWVGVLGARVIAAN